MPEKAVEQTYKCEVEIVLCLSSVSTSEQRLNIYLLQNDNGKFFLPTKAVTKTRGCWQTVESMIYDWVILPPDSPRNTAIQHIIENDSEYGFPKERKIQILFSFTVNDGFNHVFEDSLVKFTQDEFVDLVLSKDAETKFEPGHLNKAKLAVIKEAHGPPPT